MGCGKSTQVHPDAPMEGGSSTVKTKVDIGEEKEEDGTYVAESVTEEDYVHVGEKTVESTESIENAPAVEMEEGVFDGRVEDHSGQSGGVIDNQVVPLDEDGEDKFDPEVQDPMVEMTPSANQPSRSRTTSFPLMSHVDRHGQLLRDDEDPTIVPEKKREREREREKKWLEMLPKWDKQMKSDSSQLKKRIRKGIPSSLRGMVWMKLLDSEAYKTRMDTWLQDKLQTATSVRDVLGASVVSKGNPDWLEPSYTAQTLLKDVKEQDKQSYFRFVTKVASNGDSLILKDTPRTFPHMARFHAEAGKHDQSEVCRAWTHYMHDVGYCQGLSFMAAVLLMYLPPDDAFYALIAMNESEKLDTPKDLYKSGFAKLHRMSYIVKAQLFSTEKKYFRKLEDAGFDLSMVLPQWFICSFCYNLPVNIALRIWDIFFLEGPKVLYRAALRLILNKKKQVMSAPGSMDVLSLMCIEINKDFTAMADEDKFIQTILDVDITRDEIAKFEKEYLQTK